MAKFGWRLHFRAACGAGRRRPSGARLAKLLRDEASHREPIDPKLLLELADMLDPPAGRKAAKLRIIPPRGGRRAEHDWVKVGAAARRLLATGMKKNSVLFEVAEQLGTDEITVRRALKNYEIAELHDSESND